jgi:hypothetical protein
MVKIKTVQIVAKESQDMEHKALAEVLCPEPEDTDKVIAENIVIIKENNGPEDL